MEQPQRSEAELALQAALSRVLSEGGHRAGALLVTREPIAGVDADTRILSAVMMRETNLATAVDLLQMIKRLRTLAVELETMMRAGR